MFALFVVGTLAIVRLSFEGRTAHRMEWRPDNREMATSTYKLRFASAQRNVQNL